MSLIETIIINFIFILFPLVMYLVSELISITLNNRKRQLFLDVAVISSTYLLIRYGLYMDEKVPFVLVNIALIIAYIKKREFSIIAITVLLMAYYYLNFNIPIFLLTLEYTIYYIIYIFVGNKGEKIFSNIFLTIKIIFLFIWIFIEPVMFLNIDYRLQYLLFLSLILVISYKFSVFLFLKTEAIINLHKMINKDEEEKTMYQSLFKITHEIKNPIAVCKGYLDMFDTNNKDHARRYIPILKSEINRLLVLLEDYLSINRIKIEKDIMDIDMLIEDVAKNFKPILVDKNIELDFYSKNEVFIDGDYNRLKQVLVNLIKNSIESIDSDGKIKLNYRVIKNNVYIHIEDNGIGMNKEELQKLKQPFYTTKSRGTGLGVYLSREIIEAHNGSLSYKSKKNKGTHITIKIPRGDFKSAY